MSDKVQYDPRITPEFIMACAKVGHVSMVSEQVTIQGRRELVLKHLHVPSDFFIEWIGTSDNMVQVTFRLKDRHGNQP